MIGGDAVEPGVDLTLRAEVRRLAVRLEEDLLRGIPGLLGVAQQALAEPQQAFLMGLDQGGEAELRTAVRN